MWPYFCCIKFMLMTTKPLTLFCILLVAVLPFVQAQKKSGVIAYELITDVHRSIPPEREDVRRITPRYRMEFFQLVFNDSASLYKTGKIPAGVPGHDAIYHRMPGPEVFIDRKAKEMISKKVFLGKDYLIAEPLELQAWRFGYEQADIQGYRCMMAWMNDTVQNQDITVWFTPEIKPFMGPEHFVTLPGTVLAVDINNGEKVWVARNITFREPATEEVRKPASGESTSRTDFEHMVNEYLMKLGVKGISRP